MKTSAMIAMLEKNPTLRFKRVEDHSEGLVVEMKDGFIQWVKGPIFALCERGVKNIVENTPFTTRGTLDADWQLVREPVPVWEAIKALTEGKTIEREYSDGRTLSYRKLEQGYIHICDLTGGRWYINE